MCYTVITEEYKEDGPIKRPVVHNIETSNFEKLIAVIYSGIDMDGSSEKMRIINLPSNLKGKAVPKPANIQKAG